MVKINKKAMEMSLNLIIMLIIGMVVLGLVIGFVNSLVNKGSENFNRQLNANEQYELDAIKSCPDNLCISPVKIEVQRGKKTSVFIKVRAYEDSMAQPAGQMAYLTSASTTAKTLGYIVTPSDSSADAAMTAGSAITFPFSGPGFTTTVVGDELAQAYTLTVPGATKPGIYYLSVYHGTVEAKTVTLIIS